MTREEAKEFIAQSVKGDVDIALLADAIKTLEQRIGHWIHHDFEDWVCAEHWECSYCHETTMTNPMYPYNTYNHMYYCPKCGADMGESFEKLPRTEEEAQEAYLAYQRSKENR